MTLRHVVAWKLATEDPTERAAQAQKIADDLNALAGVVPEIESIAVGPDVVGGANWDVVLVADFAHRDELRLAQHLQMLRHGRLADTELVDDLRDARAVLARGRSLAQKLQDVPTGTVGDHVEDVRHALRLARAARRGG